MHGAELKQKNTKYIFRITRRLRGKQNVPINLWTIISGANHPGTIITFTDFFKVLISLSLFTVGRSEWYWTYVLQVNSGKGTAKPN